MSLIISSFMLAILILYILICFQKQEIERLNNIINELEKWLEDKYKNALQDDNYWEVLKKLLELKGSDKK